MENSKQPAYPIPVDLIDEIIKYIEETEECIDGLWGSCRNFKELIHDNCMPELYHKMLKIKADALLTELDKPTNK